MTAEAGERNGRSEGSKVEFEVRGGGDLKDNGVAGGGIACRGNGEEIGGSFVIVNGDSDDHSDRSDLDPATKSENGEADATGVKEERSPLENERRENFFGVRSNGDGEGENVMGSGSDAKVGQEPHVLVAEPEKEPKLEEIEKEGGMDVDLEEREEVGGPSEAGSDVKIEPKEGVVVEEVEAEEMVEVLPCEEREAEAVVVIGESDSKGELGSEVENADVMEPETAELESASPVEDEQEPAPVVVDADGKRDGGVINVAHVDADGKGDGGVIDVAGETENAAEVEFAVEAETKEETHTAVEETGRFAELVSAVEEEKKEEPITEVATSERLAELGSAVEVEPEQQPHTVAKDMHKGEVEPKEETHTAFEETGGFAELESAVEEERKEEPITEVATSEKLAELGSAVEVEQEQQPRTVAKDMHEGEVEEAEEPKLEVEGNGIPVEVEVAVELEPQRESETVLDVADNIETDEQKEHENVVEENSKSGHLPSDNGGAWIPSVDGDASIDEPSDQPENGSADSVADINGDTLKDELNGEARNIPLEDAESTALCHVVEKELVEEITRSTDGEHVEQEVSSGDTILSEAKADVSSEDIKPRLLDPATGVGLEPKDKDKDNEVELKYSVEDVKTIKDVAVNRMKLVSESGNEDAESSECVESSIEGDQCTTKDDDEETSHEQVQAAGTIQAPPEIHAVEPSVVYMVKVPRPLDDELRKKIQDAQKRVEATTKTRDDIGVKTREQAKIVYDRSLDYKAELAKERAARAIYKAKRQELDEVQEKIGRINNANSISDIDEKIRSMIHRQQHETMSLKQEKQYIHDINQMKRMREQLSSKNALQEEIDEALKQGDQLEASFNNLKKELDSKKAACLLAENSRKSAWDIYKAEEESLKKLKEEHTAADVVRQEAYSTLRKLRNEFAEKAKYFKMYKADLSALTNYRFSRDSQGIRCHCNRQVEKMMDLWNSNAEFREQYVKSNMQSYKIRNLGISDGRQLGPGEEAPIIQSNVNKNSNTISTPSSIMQSPAPLVAAEVRQGDLTEPSATKQEARTNKSTKLKSSTKSAPVVGDMPTVSNSEEPKGEDEKNNKFKKEEEEMIRKAEELARKEEELRKAKAAKEEELRKEKAAAELKEQLRLEQKAKAREAEERKRRKADKAKAKAEYRAQKEAELKEKKKAKKENKKYGSLDMPNGGAEDANSPMSEANVIETSRETEISGAVTRKRSTRPASSARQYNKVQAPLPLPLRNRGKRKMTWWMWALLVVLLVLVLFIAGNYISLSTSSVPDFGF